MLSQRVQKTARPASQLRLKKRTWKPLGAREVRVVKEADAARSCMGVERRKGRAARVEREGFGDARVGVVGEVVATPAVGSRLGVVCDDVVGAPGEGEVSAAANDGGLPGFAAADVGVVGAAAATRGGGGPVAPASAAGVPEGDGGGGGGVGGSGVRLLVIFD